MEPQQVALVGAGSWATALAKCIGGNGHRVHWYVRRPEVREAIALTGHHPNYLKATVLPVHNLCFPGTLAQAVQAAPVVLLVVPTAHLETHLCGLAPQTLSGKTVATAIKGLMPGTGQLVCQYVTQTMQVPDARYVAILGPGHAEEVAEGATTYLSVCGQHAQTAQAVADLLRGNGVYANPCTDVEGAELASALKNVYALLAGVALGLGYGDNFISVLVANALAEMEALLQARFPAPRSVAESVYAGDLLVTAYSPHSRNRRMGFRLGQGEAVPNILANSQMVAEGYHVAQLLHAQQLPEMPLVAAARLLLVQHQPPAQVFRALEARLR